MKLSELEAEFVQYDVRGDGRIYIPHVDTLAEAHGVQFLCPKCFAANNGPVGTHLVGCWFVGCVPESAEPGPGRWNPSGTGLEDLTFVPPGAFSVQINGGCNWHGYVKNGGAE